MNKNEITPEKLAKMIDQTLLKPYVTLDDLREHCEKAKEYNFKTVAINNAPVPFCKKVLEGSDVLCDAAVSFPLGQCTIDTKVFEAKDVIEKYTHEEINADEIAFITLHIHSAISVNKVGQSMEVMRVIREFFKKLQADLNIRIDANSLSYIRLMNHIKFLLLRLNNDEKLQMDITDFTKEKFPFAYEQARVLCEQLSHVLHKELPDSELGYLALHLERILSSTITS